MRPNALCKALVLAGLMAGNAVAGNHFVHSDEQMTIKVIAEGGQAEVITIDNLEVGQSRELTTESGKSVLVSRDEQGLVVDVGGELIEVDLPTMHDDLRIAAMDLGDGDHEVVVLEDIEELIDDNGKRIIVKSKTINATGDEVDIDIQQLLDDLELDGAADGEVVIIKKHVEVEETEEL